MKKATLIPAIIGILMSYTVYADSNHPLIIFNNSKDYNMSIQYYVCAAGCSGPYSADIPSIKSGKNYIEINSNVAIVTKVVENGKTVIKMSYNDGWYFCRAGMTGDNDLIKNAIVLDDMQGTDHVLCTQSTMPGVDLSNTDSTDVPIHTVSIDKMRSPMTGDLNK